MFLSLPKIWFNFIHSNFLVYNICWEDSDIDRELLQINAQTELLTITSAGCNVLNYLLDSPKSIHCIDINPKQTALLEFKVALIIKGDHKVFFEFFGKGQSKDYKEVYKVIREHLSTSSQSFWDTHIKYFDPRRNGLFYNGGSGLFARFLNRTIDKKELRKVIDKLIHETNKGTRNELFKSIEAKLWSGIQRIIWKSPLILSLAGVPKSQRELLVI